MSKVNSEIKRALTLGPDFQIPKQEQVDNENIQKQLVDKKWEDFDNTYTELAQIIANSATSFRELVRLSANELANYISPEEHAEITILTRGFSNDINMVSGELVRIKKSHSGFKGKPTKETDLLKSISVLEAYLSVHDKTLALLPVTTVRVAEIVGEAASRREAQGAVPHE